MAVKKAAPNPIVKLAETDGRYQVEAFHFVQETVCLTSQWVRNGDIKAQNEGPRGGEGEFHVSGQELLCGVLRNAREKWGLLAPVVLHSWGVNHTEDIGEIVFLMVEDESMEWKIGAA